MIWVKVKKETDSINFLCSFIRKLKHFLYIWLAPLSFSALIVGLSNLPRYNKCTAQNELKKVRTNNGQNREREQAMLIIPHLLLLWSVYIFKSPKIVKKKVKFWLYTVLTAFYLKTELMSEVFIAKSLKI